MASEEEHGKGQSIGGGVVASKVDDEEVTIDFVDTEALLAAPGVLCILRLRVEVVLGEGVDKGRHDAAGAGLALVQGGGFVLEHLLHVLFEDAGCPANLDPALGHKGCVEVPEWHQHEKDGVVENGLQRISIAARLVVKNGAICRAVKVVRLVEARGDKYIE